MTRRRRVVALVAAVLLVASLGALLAEVHRRGSLYWYDPATDYDYAFMSGGGERTAVALGSGSLVLPRAVPPGSSALLKVGVQSTLAGRLLEPGIEILAPGVPDGSGCAQYFERGGEGVRYLDLCARGRGLREGDTLRLRWRHARPGSTAAELLVFPPVELDRQRILVVAPHPDDAEIAAFGLYAGRDAWVVTVTHGGYGGARYTDMEPDSTERALLEARLRVWDSLVIPVWGGVPPERAVNLGYATLGLTAMRADPRAPYADPADGSTDIARWRRLNTSSALDGRPASPTWENLVGDLRHLIERLRPDVIVAPHPSLDANRDHVATAAATLEALGRTLEAQEGQEGLEPQAAGPRLLLYTNHHVHTEYFPFGPARAWVSLPPWFDRSVTFRAVHSLPLTPEVRRAKLLALDMHHDLRPAPSPVERGPLPTFLGRLGGMVRALIRDPARELSYFRRAPRPNELFFVYAAADRALLEQWAANALAKP